MEKKFGGRNQRMKPGLAERVKFGEAKTGIEGGEKLGNEYSTLDL